MKKNFTLCLIALANCVFSQWNYSPAINNAACVQPYNQINTNLTSDLKGGTIIVWEDFRNDPTNTTADIYAQRIDASGVVMWQMNGVAICTDLAHQTSPTIVPDSLGGAYIVWQDSRTPNTNLFAQRVDSSGNVLWTSNGIGVTLRSFYQKNPKLLNDGSNGLIVLWQDSAGANDIYGQRLDPSGNQLWPNGVGICTFPLSQVNVKAQITPTGEIYVAWQDKRNGSDYDIYAQKLNLAGVSQWTANGVSICMLAQTQSNPRIALDGSGGAIIVWQDKRTGADYDVYAQRINSSGTTLWTANGKIICNSPGSQSAIDITSTNISNGAIITWKDARGGSGNLDIYAQLVDMTTSIPQWTANGIPVCNTAGNQKAPNIISDGVGGAIISYQDSSGGSWDIKAQRINASGTLLWTAGGVDVGIASGDQVSQSNIVVSSGSSIYSFQDLRNGVDYDIYAYKLDINGNPVGISQINRNKEAATVFPNPSSEKVSFKIANSTEKWQLKITDVNGNEILNEEIKNSEKYELTNKLEAGIYFYSIQTNNFSTKGKFVILN